MTLSDDLRRVATFVEQLEARGVAVEAAAPTERDGERLTVELEVSLTPGTTLEPLDTTASEPTGAEEDGGVSSDGEEQGSGETGEAPTAPEPTVVDASVVVATEPVPTVEPTSAEPEADDEGESDRTVCRHPTCDATFETRHGMKIHYTKVHVTGGDETEPHRDPERLREVYERCDTFAEMRDALGATVTPATVRHHLIEHGIHEPTPNAATAVTESGVEAEAADTTDAEAPAVEPAITPVEEEATAGDAPGESRPPEPGLDPTVEVHAGVTVEELIDSVADASTVYDVERALSLDREETTALLDTLDILEIVHGRVATKPDRDALRAEIDDRIRANVETLS